MSSTSDSVFSNGSNQWSFQNEVAINPMYQTSSFTTLASVQPPPTPSEYDEIKHSRSVVLSPETKRERTTTENVLYATHGSTLKHPILHESPPVSPQTPFEVDDDEPCCKCSADAFLFVISILVIFLSIAAIVLILLLWFGVISLHDSSSTRTVVVTPSTPTNPQNQCNCSIPLTTSSLNLTAYQSINKSITRIKLELQQLRVNEMPVNVTHQRLNDLLLQVKSINDSVQQLRPQSNYRQPQLTGLNLPANIIINHSDCVNEVYVCTQNPSSFPIDSCSTERTDYATSTHIILTSTCSITPLPANNVLSQHLNGTFGIKQVQPRQGQTIFSNDTALERLMKSESICLCYGYNINFSVKCYNLVKRCSYQRNNVTATINT